jgi:heptosyltransferase-1
MQCATTIFRGLRVKCLIIKTSSLGDVIHTLPALTDAVQHFPTLQFDWIVEENFQQIPALHSHVNRVIPIAIRRWRKNLTDKKTYTEIKNFLDTIRAEKYDYVLDAQGLVKSALITPFAKGPSYGLDWSSARESFASIFYRHKINVNFKQHAIVRMRELFAKTFQYPIPIEPAIGLDRQQFQKPANAPEKYLVFLHGTTWATKLWPLLYWQQLAKLAAQANWPVLLPWGSLEEKQAAETIKQNLDNVIILPKQTLVEMAGWLAHANGIVAVDTGLGHLAAALTTPSLSLYGPTDPTLTGTMGLNQHHLSVQFPCAPCFSKVCTYQGASEEKPACFTTLPADKVWQSLLTIIQ